MANWGVILEGPPHFECMTLQQVVYRQDAASGEVVPWGMLQSVQHPSMEPEPHSLYSLTFVKQQQFWQGCKVDVLRKGQGELVRSCGKLRMRGTTGSRSSTCPPAAQHVAARCGQVSAGTANRMCAMAGMTRGVIWWTISPGGAPAQHAQRKQRRC
ncbi:hypothetical protein WJX72_008343 [[Myrmecia] bisecta]|uniref:Uncharacterized protein n=1 Tax=[Myrmecia] bisecta TaxID=41462 RepID=A0AAW1PTI2_9CHLO